MSIFESNELDKSDNLHKSDNLFHCYMASSDAAEDQT